jgi:hypothetical protein
MSTTTTSPSEEVLTRIEGAAALFNTDVTHMTDEMLASSPGGKARCGFDLIYEVALINRLVAGYAAQDGTVFSPPEGWVVAPDAFRQKTVALDNFNESVSAACSAIRALPAERLDEIVDSPLGKVPLSRLAGILPMHIMYHSGQLNYIQTMHGDDNFHWAG